MKDEDASPAKGAENAHRAVHRDVPEGIVKH